MGVIVAILMMLLLAALGAALTCTSITETQIAGNYRANAQAVYAADAAIEIAVNHLVTMPDWTLVHSGAVVSPLVDGGPAGIRQTPAGPVDLMAATNLFRSGPAGRLWQLYAHTRLRNVVPLPATHADIYLVVWVAGHPGAPGPDAALLLAQAYGPYGVRRAVEAAVSRTPISGVRITARREMH